MKIAFTFIENPDLGAKKVGGVRQKLGLFWPKNEKFQKVLISIVNDTKCFLLCFDT